LYGFPAFSILVPFENGEKAIITPFSCYYVVYKQRVEDRVLRALVRKTDIIKRELGSLARFCLKVWRSDHHAEVEIGYSIKRQAQLPLYRSWV